MIREAYCATCGPTEADERGCIRCSYQYDDNGDPIVPPSDRILRALRFHDWIEPSDLYDQLELDSGSTERGVYQSAMYRLVKSGLVERRSARYWDDVEGHHRTVTTIKLAARASFERVVAEARGSK